MRFRFWGKWNLLPNAVRLQDGSVHEYCPPEHVAAEMDRLLIPTAPLDDGPPCSIEDTIRRIGRKLEQERMRPNRRASIREKVDAVRDEAARQFETLARQLTQAFASRRGYRLQIARADSTVCLQIDVPQPWRIACAVAVSATVAPPNDFLITYAEPLPELQSRFTKWLETQLIKTLDLWQRQL